MINTYGLKIGDWLRYRDPTTGRVTHLKVWLVEPSPVIHAHQGPGRFGITFTHGSEMYRRILPVESHDDSLVDLIEWWLAA